MIEARLHLCCPPGTLQKELLERCLEMVALANSTWFDAHPKAPCCLKCAGVTYYLPPKREHQSFFSAPEVLKRGRATCAEAVTYCAGKAISEGKACRIELEQTGPADYHAVVWVTRADGTEERLDPTSELDGYEFGDGSLCCDLLRVGSVRVRTNRSELARSHGRDGGKARALTARRPTLDFQKGPTCPTGAYSCRATTED